MSTKKDNKAGENKLQPSSQKEQKVIKVVKLNPLSSYFYDPTSGLKLTPGKEVEVTPNITASKRYKFAVTNGQLLVTNKTIEADVVVTKQETKVDLEALSVKARKVYDESEPENIIDNFKKDFTPEELKTLAVEKFEIILQEGFTEDDVIDEIVAAIDLIVENENN